MAFSAARRLVLSIHTVTLQSRANALLIHSIYANAFTPFALIVATIRFRKLLGHEKSARSFLQKVFLRPPRVMDVRHFGSRSPAQKTLFSCAPSYGVKVFGPGRPPGYPPGRTRDIPPKNYMFIESEKRHPKKSNTKICFCPLPPLQKFFVFAFFIHCQEKKQPEHKEFQGLKDPKRW